MVYLSENHGNDTWNYQPTGIYQVYLCMFDGYPMALMGYPWINLKSVCAPGVGIGFLKIHPTIGISWCIHHVINASESYFHQLSQVWDTPL